MASQAVEHNGDTSNEYAYGIVCSKSHFHKDDPAPRACDSVPFCDCLFVPLQEGIIHKK